MLKKLKTFQFRGVTCVDYLNRLNSMDVIYLYVFYSFISTSCKILNIASKHTAIISTNIL